jgi:hypothetical protein
LCGCEWRCFIFCCILGLGAVEGRDVPGRGMLWMLVDVILKFSEQV